MGGGRLRPGALRACEDRCPLEGHIGCYGGCKGCTSDVQNGNRNRVRSGRRVDGSTADDLELGQASPGESVGLDLARDVLPITPVDVGRELGSCAGTVVVVEVDERPA